MAPIVAKHINDILCALDSGWAKKGDVIMLAAQTQNVRLGVRGYETWCYIGQFCSYSGYEATILKMNGCIILKPYVEITGIGKQPNIDWSECLEPYVIKTFNKFSEIKKGQEEIARSLESIPGFDIYASFVRSLKTPYEVSMQKLSVTGESAPSSKNFKKTDGLIKLTR